MNDMPARKSSSRSDHRLTHFAATLLLPYLHTFFQYGRAPGTMNGAIYASASQQRSIRRIDDRIDLHPGNVTSQQLNVIYHTIPKYKKPAIHG